MLTSADALSRRLSLDPLVASECRSDDFAMISADGHAGRARVRSLAVTNVVTAMRSADEAKARPASAARPDVAGEVVAQLVDLNVE